MGIYDDVRYPWLRAEKALIEEAINADKIVLGICLGAQLIADVLGARVYKNTHREIGWFRINRSPEANNCVLSKALPEEVDVFHWHGDTFDIPQGAILLAENEACKHQGFMLDNRVAAFQFHLETTFQSATALIENCRDELDGAPYVQSEVEILADRSRFLRINQVMTSVLEALEAGHVLT
jgi:GMP synthase-like glutamine amidotransferase